MSVNRINQIWCLTTVSNEQDWGVKVRKFSRKYDILDSDDLENVNIINIDSDESEQSNFYWNYQEEAKDVSTDLDDSESQSQMRR